jgi:CRISPR type IV-associated protein Csf3
MQPLRIEFQLCTPWSPPAYGVHFDGLLALQVVQASLRAAPPSSIPDLSLQPERQGEPKQGVDYAELISDLPLQKYESESGWCWKASKLKAVNYLGQERRYLTAKTPVFDMARKIVDGVVDSKGGSVIDTQRGIGKNSSLYYTLEHVAELHAWCVGDKDGIEYYLSKLRAIGVKTRLGHGSLSEFDDGKLFRIVEDDEALTKWQYRNLPDRLSESMYPGIGTTHPPYWKDKSYCWLPCEA